VLYYIHSSLVTPHNGETRTFTMASPGELDALAGTPPHVMFIPSAGMAHLVPFCRFIAALSSRGVDCSIVTVLPTVSAAEADHLAGLFKALPCIRRVDFNLLPFDAVGTDSCLARSRSPPCSDGGRRRRGAHWTLEFFLGHWCPRVR